MKPTFTAPRLDPQWRRRLFRYRRWLAAALVGLAALLIVTAVQPESTPSAQQQRPQPHEGFVAAPITLEQVALAQWLQPGDVVDVIATTGNGDVPVQSDTIAQQVRVLELPNAGGGAFGASGTSALVILEVTREVGIALASAEASAALTVVRTQ